MQYLLSKIIIDINELISNNKEWKNQLIKKWIINLLIFAKEKNISIFFISTNDNARNILINEIAKDIENEVDIQIFDKKNFQNSWSVWKVENSINKSNSIFALTSIDFINFLKNDNLFTIFLDAFNSSPELEKLANKTSYKKVIDINQLIDELPNILFKLDSFLND